MKKTDFICNHKILVKQNQTIYWIILISEWSTSSISQNTCVISWVQGKLIDINQPYTHTQITKFQFSPFFVVHIYLEIFMICHIVYNKYELQHTKYVVMHLACNTPKYYYKPSSWCTWNIPSTSYYILVI